MISKKISQRQIQVWKMTALSETTKSQAEILGIKPKTVEGHRKKLMDNLKIYDYAGLTRRAIRVGLIKP